MFELEVWQAPITDNQGNILPGAQITVFNSDDTVATIYDDLDRKPKANPFNVGTDALARFYAEPGRYRVQAQSGTDIAVYDNADLSQKALRSDLGYAGSFETGFTITNKGQFAIFKGAEADGSYIFRWDGALPKEVPANSSPGTTGGVDVGAWLDVGQAALRSELSNGSADINGLSAEFIANKVAGLKTFSANRYGADTSAMWTVNRDAIQAANNAAAANGGGVVTMTPGIYEVKGVLRDSHVFFDMGGVTLKNPDGNAPDVLTTRLTTHNGSAAKGSAQITLTTGNTSNIEVGTRVGVFAAGGLLDSQETTLVSDINATTTTIELASVKGLAVAGTLLVGDELISYSGRTSAVLTGVTRGAFGTTAAAHSTGDAISIARRLYATVIGIDGMTLTLNREAAVTCTGVPIAYGVIGGGITGFPTIDGNKEPTGSAGASAYGVSAYLASFGYYDLKIINGETGGMFFTQGCAYNYGERIFLHNCSVPLASKGSAFWLFRGCEHNHFNHIEITGDSWVGVYLDDRTTTNNDGWDASNSYNTFITINTDTTLSTTGMVQVVGGRYNRFLGGRLKAPRIGINCSDSEQGNDLGETSIGNEFSGFTFDVGETPYTLFAAGNSLHDCWVERGSFKPVVATGNNVYAVSPAKGVAQIMPKGYRKNALPNTRISTWAGWFIPTSSGTGDVNGVIDLSDTVGNNSPIVYNDELVVAAGKETYAARMDVTVPSSFPSITLRLAIVAYSGNLPSPSFLASASGPSITINAGETKQLSAYMPITPDAATGLRVQLQMRSAAASGRRIEVNPKPTLEKNAVDVVSLFNGDDDGAIWLGTEDDSQSLLFT